MSITEIIAIMGASGLFVFLVEVLKTTRLWLRDRHSDAIAQTEQPLRAESMIVGSTREALMIQRHVTEELRVDLERQRKEVARLRGELLLKENEITALQTMVGKLQMRMTGLTVRMDQLPDTATGDEGKNSP